MGTKKREYAYKSMYILFNFLCAHHLFFMLEYAYFEHKSTNHFGEPKSKKLNNKPKMDYL